MLKRTGSKVVIDALVDAGVTTVFGYPGGAIMPFYDALLDSALDHVLVRHEQSATHAADGYARAGGRLGVCIATSGPGATNLVTGICTAAMDSTPFLCITGQVPTALIGTDAFQEADIPGVVTAISKHYYQVRDVDELPEVISEAIFVATTGRPGPVVVDIPKDVQVATTTRRCEPIEEIDGYVARPVRPQQGAPGPRTVEERGAAGVHRRRRLQALRRDRAVSPVVRSGPGPGDHHAERNRVG
jgi:acetolactate synthase-1/2/3 large subunit